MKNRLIIFLLFNLFLSFCAASEHKNWNRDGVDKIAFLEDELELRNFLARSEKALVSFCAPWSKICKQFYQQMKLSAELVFYDRPRVHLAVVNCATEGADHLCANEGVKEYPHLKYYEEGEFKIEPKVRTEEQITKFVRAKSAVASKHIRSKSEFDELLNHPEPVVIGFFDSKQGTDQCGSQDEDDNSRFVYKGQYFKVVQELIEKYRFAHITERKFAAELFGENVSWDSVIFHRSNWETSRFEESYDKYEQNELTIGKFRKWIEEAEHPTNFCPHVTLRNFKDIQPNRVLILHSEDQDKSPQNVKYWRNRLVQFAKEKTERLMYKYNFCMGARRHFQSLVFNELGGNAGWAQESPKVVLWDKNWRSFVMEEALDSALLNLSQFLKNFEAGNLRPFIKSEIPPPPEAQKAGDHVKVAVGTTFNKIVLDTQKDTLVAIVAQNCGYCQALMPTLKTLARSLKEEESVDIVTIDGELNHPPRAFEYKGFPTIYFAKKFQKNEPIRYKGQRTEEALLEFIKEHSSKRALTIDGVKQKEYDYDEIVAASEIEVDEIIEGDSRNSAEHDEL